MYYVPQYFKAYEIFPPKIFQKHLVNSSIGAVSDSIWRLMDRRILWTVDQLRKIHGPMIVNDYFWGGNNLYRGFRPVEDLIDYKGYQKNGVIVAKWSSLTSQHCFGRAIDCKFKQRTAEEVRQHIRDNPFLPHYKYITAIEDGVSWFHFDVRNWNINKSGILFFKA